MCEVVGVAKLMEELFQNPVIEEEPFFRETVIFLTEPEYGNDRPFSAELRLPVNKCENGNVQVDCNDADNFFHVLRAQFKNFF